MSITINRYIAGALMAVSATAVNAQQVVAHLDMSADGGMITELVSKRQSAVTSALPVVCGSGISGEALRFDGYSNFVKATLPVESFSKSQLTVSMVLAAETYPMMNTAEAENTPSYATILGNLDETARQGFAFQLSSQGGLRFKFGSVYANGYVFSIESSEKMLCGRWNVLTAVMDKAGNKATLYLNGKSVGTCKMSRSELSLGSSSDFTIGKAKDDQKSGPFLINTFCGLIDDITVYNGSLSEEKVVEMAKAVDDVTPDFNYPAARYSASLWRPQFHGMPSGGWTNESHGMTYSDGRYHVFFQKNANGPYMARLHWGHISSANLYKWREEPIAIAPGEAYDIKGCWSGCVYDDNGTPNILYTAVDNGRAVIAGATPKDKSLISWEKKGIAINGRPAGLSDDFRDPYFFSANGQKYVIVGTSKDGFGACTLHKYENDSWTNDGKIFFKSSDKSLYGTFWEMPNLTRMDNGKWLFTVTPLGMNTGVKTIYWIGTVASDGTFLPDSDKPKTLELNGISKDGYGLLSPTICQHDGKTLMLGIVPDKVSGEQNYEMGWAHNYSLPREIWINANGELCQKPYSGLQAMRTDVSFQQTAQIMGSLPLSPVSGRQIELRGEFKVGSGEMGFRFLKHGDHYAALSYNTATGAVTLDLSRLERRSNDAGPYNGIYSASLPERPALGDKIVLHVFLDGSIADVFINDTHAFSVRLFPTDNGETAVEAFATSATEASVSGWTLDANRSGGTGISAVAASGDAIYNNVYDIEGRKLASVPQKGIYIINSKKYASR